MTEYSLKTDKERMNVMKTIERCRNLRYLIIFAAVFAVAFIMAFTAGTGKVSADDYYAEVPVIELGKDYTVTVPANTGNEVNGIYYRFKDKNSIETDTVINYYNFVVMVFYVSGDGTAGINHWFTDGGVTTPIIDIADGVNKNNQTWDREDNGLLGCYDDKDDLFEFYNDTEYPVTVRFRVARVLKNTWDKPSDSSGGSSGATPGTAAKVSGATVKVISSAAGSTPGTVAYTSAPNKSSVTVPAAVNIQGEKYKVTQIDPEAFKSNKIRKVTIGSNVKIIKKNAFKGSKVTRIIIKTKLLKKAKIKLCLKGSKVKTVQIMIGSKKVNKKYVKSYKKIFTKANAGKKVTVK